MTGPLAHCAWCRAPLVMTDGAYWCGRSAACRQRQADYAVQGVTGKGTAARKVWLFVPTPKQVAFLDHSAKNRLFGGAAGPGKSHAARWGLYRKCLTVKDFEGLIVRKTMPELKKSHIRKLRTERQALGGDAVTDWNKTDSLLTFHETGAMLEFGHLGDEDAVDKYLSSEYDEICVDEGSTIEGEILLELSTRARTSKPHVQAAGGAKFDVVTNPGGIGWPVLRDFFVDHAPDFDQFPAMATRYHPEQWAYIKALLDDNPYRDPDYEDTLARLNPVRYEQLRWGAEHLTEGQFFPEWRETRDGVPWHVREWVA